MPHLDFKRFAHSIQLAPVATSSGHPDLDIGSHPLCTVIDTDASDILRATEFRTLLAMWHVSNKLIVLSVFLRTARFIGGHCFLLLD